MEKEEQAKPFSLKNIVKAALLFTTSSFGICSGAYAQQQPVAVAAVDAEASGQGIGDIIVTARRRSENLQKTPVSASVLSGKNVETLNLRNFQDLKGVISNLEIVPLNNGGSSITIRGVGQTSAQANVDAKAGFYVNDMYVARQEGNALYFYDVDTLQVLKGPQGTLFGKNTTGGALILTTAAPGSEDSGYVKIRGGSYKRLDTEGAINVPLTDNLWTRLSFRTDRTDGYIHHVLDDNKSNNINDQSVRFQLRYKPDDRLTFDLLGEYNRSATNGSTDIITGCGPNDFLIRNYNSVHAVPYCTAYPVLNSPYLVYGGASLSIPTSSLVTDTTRGGDSNGANTSRNGHLTPFANTEVKTFNSRLAYALSDNLTVKSITAYRDSYAAQYNPKQDAPNELYGELDRTGTKQFSQEFNGSYQSDSGRFTATAGLFYSYQKTYLIQDTGPDYFDPIGYLYVANNKYQSYAIYGQASYKIVPKLELTLGGRYTYDKKSANSSVFTQTKFAAPCATFAAAFAAGAAACGGFFTGANSASWNNFDPRAQLSYQFNSDLFAYASVTRGYNAGGFNQQLGANLGGTLISYDPEKLTSYEAGVKTQWFDRKLRVNMTGFYQEYQDIQTTVSILFNGITTRQVQTGATAHEQGFEGEVLFQPVPDLTFHAEGSYLYQKYDSVRAGVNFTTATPVNTAPKYTYSLSGDYMLHMGKSTLNTSLNWRAAGKKPACTPVGSCYIPAFGLLGARLDFKLAPDSPWQFSLWGTNLTDKIYMLNRSYLSLQAYTPGRPRELGFEVKRTF